MPTVPQQARSRRTLDRIVNAALAVVAEHGADEATIQEIVRRARSSVGSFYSRFDGKDELIAYLQEQVWDDALESWTDLLSSERTSEGPSGERAPMDLRAGVESVVEALMADREGHRLRLRAFGFTPNGSGPEAVARFRSGVLALVHESIAPHQVEIGHPEPSLAITLGFYAAKGALQQMDADASVVLDDEGVASELTRIYLGYLGGEAGYGRDGPQIADPFDVWT